jgi:sugar phosphate isomerase/epimerase
MHTHQWKNDADELVAFRTGEPVMATDLIRGVLESNGIPCFVFGGHYIVPLTIKVPASRVEDAERALEEARKMGEQMAADGE